MTSQNYSDQRPNSEGNHTAEGPMRVLGHEPPSIVDLALLPGMLQGTVAAARTDEMGLPLVAQEVGELQAVSEYLRFIEAVKQTAQQDPSDEGKRILAQVASWQEWPSFYMSHELRRQAVEGFLGFYEARLRADPAMELFFLVPRGFRNKSTGLVTGELLELARVSRPDLLPRLRIVDLRDEAVLEDLRRRDPAQLALIVFEDWVISGRQMAELLDYVGDRLTGSGLGRLRHRLEVNLLAADSDAAARVLAGLRSGHGFPPMLAMTVYFLLDEFGRNIAGSHSTPDFNFAYYLMAFWRYYQERTGNNPPIDLPVIARLRKRSAEFEFGTGDQ